MATSQEAKSLILESDAHVLAPGINAEAFVAQLGEQDQRTIQPGIIVLEGGLNGSEPAKFIPKALAPAQTTTK